MLLAKLLFRSSIFAPLIAMLSLATPSVAKAETCSFSVGWEEWAPFNVPTDGDPVGLDMQIVADIASLSGCNVQYRELPWSRHLVMLDRGEVDLAMGATPTPEREEFVDFSEPYRTEAVHLFFRQGEPERTVEELLQDGAIIGYTIDYALGDRLEALIKKYPEQFDGVTEHGLNLLKLARGRIDATLDDVYAGAQAARNENYAVYASQSPEFATGIHIMISKKSDPNIRRIVNECLEEMRRSGRLQDLISGYVRVSQAN